MSEIYNFLEQGPSYEYLIMAIVGIVAVLIFIFAAVICIKRCFNRANPKKILSGVLLIAIVVVTTVFAKMSYDNFKNYSTYSDYQQAMENGYYLTEIGKIEEFKTNEFEDGYEPSEIDNDKNNGYVMNVPYTYLSFSLNGKTFDSYNAATYNPFSEENIELIRNSETAEVKYVVDDNGNNIILSMSVGQPNN